MVRVLCSTDSRRKRRKKEEKGEKAVYGFVIDLLVT